MTAVDWTEDDFLGGQLRLRQPRDGYRIGIDTVLLAAAVTPRAGAKILDIGGGTGGISLCLATRLRGIGVDNFNIDSIELQKEHKLLFEDNIGLNNLAAHVQVTQGNIKSPPRTLAPNSYDYVLSNPPYLAAGHAPPPPQAGKAISHMDSDISLRDWTRYCLRMTRPLGYLTMVCRADRLNDILSALDDKAGDIIIFPLWPTAGQAAKRVVVQARKGGRGALHLSAGLVLHQGPQKYTREAEEVLRHGKRLDLTEKAAYKGRGTEQGVRNK